MVTKVMSASPDWDHGVDSQAVGEKAKISWRDVLLPSWRSVHATPKKTVIRRRCVWGFGGRILAGCHNRGTGEGAGNLRNTANPQTEGQLHFRLY